MAPAPTYLAMRYQRAESPAQLNGFEAASRFFKSCFAKDDSTRERLWVAHVDESARCIHLERYEGDRWSAEMPVRSIISDAARLGSAGWSSPIITPAATTRRVRPTAWQRVR